MAVCVGCGNRKAEDQYSRSQWEKYDLHSKGPRCKLCVDSDSKAAVQRQTKAMEEAQLARRKEAEKEALRRTWSTTGGNGRCVGCQMADTNRALVIWTCLQCCPGIPRDVVKAILSHIRPFCSVSCPFGCPQLRGRACCDSCVTDGVHAHFMDKKTNCMRVIKAVCSWKGSSDSEVFHVRTMKEQLWEVGRAYGDEFSYPMILPSTLTTRMPLDHPAVLRYLMQQGAVVHVMDKSSVMAKYSWTK